MRIKVYFELVSLVRIVHVQADRRVLIQLGRVFSLMFQSEQNGQKILKKKFNCREKLWCGDTDVLAASAVADEAVTLSILASMSDCTCLMSSFSGS